MKLLTKNGKLIERNGKLFTTDISRDKQIIPDSLNILFAVNTNENDLLGNMTNEAVNKKGGLSSFFINKHAILLVRYF